jgi:hypothetical protein
MKVVAIENSVYIGKDKSRKYLKGLYGKLHSVIILDSMAHGVVLTNYNVFKTVPMYHLGKGRSHNHRE